MAIQLENKTVEIQSTQRTWRVNIEAPDGQDIILTACRELVQKIDGEKIKTRIPDVTRALSKVSSETISLRDGATLSVAQIAEGLSGLIDRWETEG